MKHFFEKLQKYGLSLTVFFAMYGWFSFADYCGARSGLKWRDISGAGVALWIFLILGAIIILLQLVPAIILFFSYITGSYKTKKKVIVEEPVKEDTREIVG